MAEDGDEAWALFVAHSPEVVITHQMMPGVDGLELCRRIRSQGAELYAYIVLVVDCFKAFNDTLGHQAGDEALRAVTAALNASQLTVPRRR